jgi:hypothetical protein
VCENLAPLAVASSSGGGVGDYGPQAMNDDVHEEDDCMYHWILAYDSPVDDWIELEWSSPQTLYGVRFDTNHYASNDCTWGRALAGGDVQWWDGSSWVTDGTVAEQIDDWSYNFTAPVTTTRLRLYGVHANPDSPYQASNPVVYEWEALNCVDVDTDTDTDTTGAGASCAEAVDVSSESFPYQLSGVFDNDGEPGGTCDPESDNAVWFAYTPTATGWYEVYAENHTATDAWSRLAIFETDACDPYGPELDCVTNTDVHATATLELTASVTYLIMFYTDGEWWTMVDPEITINETDPPPAGYSCDYPADVATDNHYTGGLGEDCWSWTADPAETAPDHVFTCDGWVGGDVVVEYTTDSAQTTLSYDASITNYETNGFIAFEITGATCEDGPSEYCTSTFDVTSTSGSLAVNPSTVYYVWIADGLAGNRLPDVDLCLW